MTQLQLHPLCTFFPRLEGEEFIALRDDIAAHGLNEPIVMCDGMILDGGNRYRACIDAGVEPKFRQFSGDNLVSFVVSANFHRRHMTMGQQAAIVAGMQDWARAQTVGNPALKAQKCNVAPLQTSADRAAESGASLRTQKMADKVAKASPELVKKVAHGEVSLPKAHKQVSAKPASKILKRPEAKAADDPLDKAREYAKKQNAVIKELRATLAEREATIEALRGELNEARDIARDLAEDLESLQKSGEGDAAVAKEIKTLKGQLRAVEATRDSYMTKCNEMLRTINAKDRKIEKLEKAA